MKRSLAVGLAAVLLLASACARREPATNVVLVVLDTVGAEHVGSALPEAGHTPHIDRLAAEGVTFRRAFSTAPWTQPSVASLLTSRMPSSHGVLRLRQVLPETLVTLAERMQTAGYETAGFVTHDLLKRQLGYAQGFDHWDESHIGGHEGITSRQVTDAALAWLRGRSRSAPFFLFVHYFDPHFVYQHHPEHDLTAGYHGPLRPGMDIWDLRNQRERLTPEDVAYLVGLYREEIAFTDAQIGRLLEQLRASDLEQDTLVVLAADHGEEFMRRGWIGHTRTLYDELLHVPLVMRLPGRLRPRALDAPVSNLDVAPTVLELVGLEPDAEAQGISLVPYLAEGAPPLPERDLRAEVSFVAPRRDVREEQTVFLTALMRGDLKLIHDLASGQFALYDRAADPGERTDAFASHPRAEELRRALLAWEETRAADGAPAAKLLEPSDAELERLRALGYVQ
jgi:arylsulfatase A-like enzyme